VRAAMPRDRYGPWAVIAGASEGTGREYARQVAAAGIHCVLIARRPGPLDELAARLRAQHGVETLVVSTDLADPGALDVIRQAVGDREVGLLVLNAGADPYGSTFLDREIEDWTSLIGRNVLTGTRLLHHFGRQMRERGRGGLLIVGSGACYGGGRLLAAYSGSKAFQLCLAESLWSELQGTGVDVLYHAMSTTDTPALHQLLADLGQSAPGRMAAPADVVRAALTHLPRGPVLDAAPPSGPRSRWRRLRVRVIDRASRSVFGPA
jgi:short-subunit dehydrogenase